MIPCRYEVIVRNKPTANRWTMFFMATSFGHAEDQAREITDQQIDEEIIAINKEYDVTISYNVASVDTGYSPNH